MAEQLYGDDPEPSQRVPAGLFVPVRPGPAGWTVRLCRTPPGGRTAVGFTSRELLTAVFGRRQACVRLAEPALRALGEPLGVTALTVNPRLTAPAVREAVPSAPVAGLPRLTAGPPAHTPSPTNG
ncbi:hypothetical protein POF50_000495 [Streptomyces sp. SL13]|uniref:SseB family protein n=1 Tax=Streptantibioticus silvisoli TaxID=2705255 RepID=A0AA90KEJ0_9ACTN|nr:SAV_915 family protein [Streptantibioticus silvisoli]MDI5962332.1 hypothetical protein [Streptantibioticus silvisoli]MDI5967844.1 hypothetical protein [Streptantibioticus silvisoli]